MLWKRNSLKTKRFVVEACANEKKLLRFLCRNIVTIVPVLNENFLRKKYNYAFCFSDVNFAPTAHFRHFHVGAEGKIF